MFLPTPENISLLNFKSFLTLAFKWISLTELQFSNAETPILVTLFGMVILVKPVHLKKAFDPMPVIPSGIITLVIDALSLNAFEPIDTTLKPFIFAGMLTVASVPV